MKVDLYVNSELLEPAEDKRLISQIPLKDKMVSSHGNKEHRLFFFWNLETDNSAFKTLVSLIYLVSLNRDTGHKPCFTFGQIRAVELSDSLFFYKMYQCLMLCLQLITAKLVHVGNSMPSSPDTSSDSSGGSPHHGFDGPNVEAENCLPGVVSA